MKIAVTYQDGNVFQHFGQTERFKVYDIENNEVVLSTVVSTNGKSHGALAGILQDGGVDTVICGGIGEGAKSALKNAGITLYGGVTGTADQAVADLLENKLVYHSDVTCNHHGDHHETHEKGHSGGCGQHCHHGASHS